MSFRALVYAYVLGGITFVPLVIIALISFTIYTSVPVGDLDSSKQDAEHLKRDSEKKAHEEAEDPSNAMQVPLSDGSDIPRTRKGWLTMRRTFEESAFDGSYVTLVRSFLDARSKDPKRNRPKDMWYVVLKGKVLYLYEDEGMTECEAVLELGGHDVFIYPVGLLEGELFAKRNAICLRPRETSGSGIPTLTREMESEEDINSKSGKEKEKAIEEEKMRQDAALSQAQPWFIFVRTIVEMEDWYLSLIHASDNPANSPTLTPLQKIFKASDMEHLVMTVDEQPDVIPMRWLNALLGRIFFSYYRTQILEKWIIGRLMKKLAKVKRPAFLTDIVVTEVSIGNTAPTLSKPMLKELTKEGDASLEVQFRYKGEVRITVEATATINLGARFKSYTVKLVLAAVLREIEGNLLVKVKRPPSDRIWYAFTAPPRMVLDVEPIVSDRQITWSMILNTIESRLREIIQESVVLPNMDDIAFFDSSQYNHRGGIWEDACRLERRAASISGTSPDETSAVPPSIPDGVITVTASNEADSLPFKQSHSAGELTTETRPSLEPIPIFRSATHEGINDSVSGSASTGLDGSGTTRNRRRSWFSGVGSVDPGVPKDESEPKSSDIEPPRGRSTEVDTPVAPRSKSTPESPLAEHSPIEQKEESSNSSLNHLSPSRQPRSSSRHSQSQSSSSAEDLSSNIFDKPQSLFGTQPLSSRASSSSPSSFLSTLKSRAAAADKQALSNQAREAMRKWGVNWGGLRKDSGGNSTHDDVADVGPSTSRSRSEGINSQKSSYADVRAAVVERKEREKSGIPDPSVMSLPVALPESGRIKVRSVSVSSSVSTGNVQVHPPSPSFSPASISPSLTPQSSGEAEGSAQPKATAVSMSRSSTGSHSNVPFSNNRDTSEGADACSGTLPIHTQPSHAKTMTIPGIHASHRGEVMSMGFVAPPSHNVENKMKAPGIQSVYRLWKSPTLSGQPSSDSQSESQVQTTEAPVQNRDVVPLSLNPESSSIQLPPPERPIPPPLPPRSNAASATQMHPETPQSTFERVAPASPASEALKIIATKDESKRQPPPNPFDGNQDETDCIASLPNSSSCDDTARISSIALDTKPALPPRRIPSVSFNQ